MTEQTEQSWLTPEWHQRGIDALKDTVDLDPSKKREMVEFLLRNRLWDPEALSHQSAITRFNNCLRPGAPDFFKISHLWALMKHFDRHALFLAMAEDLDYDVRRRPTPERILRMQERAAIAFERASDELALVRSMLAKQESAPVRVHPSFREGGGSFDLAPIEKQTGEPGF